MASNEQILGPDLNYDPLNYVPSEATKFLLECIAKNTLPSTPDLLRIRQELTLHLKNITQTEIDIDSNLVLLDQWVKENPNLITPTSSNRFERIAEGSRGRDDFDQNDADDLSSSRSERPESGARRASDAGSLVKMESEDSGQLDASKDTQTLVRDPKQPESITSSGFQTPATEDSDTHDSSRAKKEEPPSRTPGPPVPTLLEKIKVEDANTPIADAEPVTAKRDVVPPPPPAVSASSKSSSNEVLAEHITQNPGSDAIKVSITHHGIIKLRKDSLSSGLDSASRPPEVSSSSAGYPWPPSSSSSGAGPSSSSVSADLSRTSGRPSTPGPVASASATNSQAGSPLNTSYYTGQSAIPFRASTPRPSKSKSTGKDTPSQPKEKRRKIKQEDADDASDLGKDETGSVADGDFTRVKPANQIPLQQFYSFCDQYFRNLTEADLKYLGECDDNVTPYIIPPLGRHYLEQWNEEDMILLGGSADGLKDSQDPKGASNQPREYDETDDGVIPGDVGFGSLTERIVSSLFHEDLLEAAEDHYHDDEPDDPVAVAARMKARTKTEMSDLEERLKNELRFIGLLPEEEEMDTSMDGDDEIVAELRRLQAELRSQVSVNRFRKDRLLEVAKKWMAWQEYNSLLDEINKQVEASYIKRFRAVKKKKSKQAAAPPAPRPVSESTTLLLNRRKRLIQELGHIFSLEHYGIPKKSIYREESPPPSVPNTGGKL
ncbi:histone acetyltransferases subunit 3-domain-containing protein [Polychytrium aggregatum]|uniref:histone acetyltransferases subunit 3-domain-containing protein n=1 Tax=Polychytrium aggregatum TaxID=110093 RepID=UPI0022FE706C|nr:histone acetyltransferases subunit 3-domain-containing protein [Polychytrium aggregatum]KAI9205339.1 histone acetyltransferases subunit 3-domain-containing protein [Polychytrium aggregatum]